MNKNVYIPRLHCALGPMELSTSFQLLGFLVHICYMFTIQMAGGAYALSRLGRFGRGLAGGMGGTLGGEDGTLKARGGRSISPVGGIGGRGWSFPEGRGNLCGMVGRRGILHGGLSRGMLRRVGGMMEPVEGVEKVVIF